VLSIIIPVAAYLALSTIAAVVLGKVIARADRLERGMNDDWRDL
jgi:hypothetical protein